MPRIISNIGFPLIGSIGFGQLSVRGFNLIPLPPAINKTEFGKKRFSFLYKMFSWTCIPINLLSFRNSFYFALLFEITQIGVSMMRTPRT